jgi:hypothetical protein
VRVRRLQNLEEIVMMADSYMPKPGKRGPYKKTNLNAWEGVWFSWPNVTPQERKRMAELVQQIQVEDDHKKFGELVDELNSLLSEKEKRFEPPQTSNWGTYPMAEPLIISTLPRERLSRDQIGLDGRAALGAPRIDRQRSHQPQQAKLQALRQAAA